MTASLSLIPIIIRPVSVIKLKFREFTVFLHGAMQKQATAAHIHSSFTAFVSLISAGGVILIEKKKTKGATIMDELLENESVERPAQTHPKKTAGFSLWAVIAVALCCSLLGGLAGGALAGAHAQTGGASASTDSGEANVSHILQSRRENAVIDIVQLDGSERMTAAEVYAKNVNSTVGITTTITTNYWGYTSTSAASGSGFIFSDDGYILTNYHVIEDAGSITVSCYDGSSYVAVPVGYDESNDIAVLKIEAEGLVPVVLGSSDALNVGDSVVAIGNPLGELTFSLTAGTISAKDREITLSSNVTMNLLQTDCAINSGNSGGALFNMYGEVVGVTNAKYSGSSGSGASIDNIGFAIPINAILPIVTSIIENGYISSPYIGVSVYDVSQESQLYGTPAGAAVKSVAQDSPAAAAGLQQGDVITAVNGQSVTSSTLKSTVAAAEVGEQWTITVYRRGETMELTLTVGQQIRSALEEEDTQRGDSDYFPWSGRG